MSEYEQRLADVKLAVEESNRIDGTGLFDALFAMRDLRALDAIELIIQLLDENDVLRDTIEEADQHASEMEIEVMRLLGEKGESDV